MTTSQGEVPLSERFLQALEQIGDDFDSGINMSESIKNGWMIGKQEGLIKNL
jgi:hypothetical protein